MDDALSFDDRITPHGSRGRVIGGKEMQLSLIWSEGISKASREQKMYYPLSFEKGIGNEQII